jgi:hypothetical protein
MLFKKIVLIFGAVDNLVSAALHLSFWKMYNFQTELPKLSNNSGALLQTENVAMVFLFLFMAVMLLVMLKQKQFDIFGRSIIVLFIGINVIRLVTGILFWEYSTTELIARIMCGLVIAVNTPLLLMKNKIGEPHVAG